MVSLLVFWRKIAVCSLAEVVWMQGRECTWIIQVQAEQSDNLSTCLRRILYLRVDIARCQSSSSESWKVTDALFLDLVATSLRRRCRPYIAPHL